MTSKRVTIRDVAKRAGVSHTAVSMAINGGGAISDTRRRQILDLIEEMDYEPRAAARMMRAKRYNQIGLIVAARTPVEAFDRDFTSPIMAHLVDLCMQQDLRYLIEFCHYDDPAPRPHHICSGLVDGGILIGDVGDSLRSWLAERRDFAWVSIGEQAPLAVMADGETAMRRLVSLLVDRGHRRLAYAGGPPRFYVHQSARKGFSDAVREHGLSLTTPELEVNTFDESKPAKLILKIVADWARQLLLQEDRPSAVFCHGAKIAATLSTVALELGLKVPEDLSIISWGSPWIAEQTYPHLTTLAVDFAKAAEHAMELLQQRIDKQTPDEPVRWLVPELVDGATLGPAPKHLRRATPR